MNGLCVFGYEPLKMPDLENNFLMYLKVQERGSLKILKEKLSTRDDLMLVSFFFIL